MANEYHKQRTLVSVQTIPRKDTKIMLIDLKKEENNFIFTKSPLKHVFYKETVDALKQMRVFFDGTTPLDILQKIRPRESALSMKHRISCYQPVLKSYCSKIIHILSRIRKAKGWKIEFDDKGELTLFEYLTKEYPVHQSLENWLFNSALKEILIDSSGIVAVIPTPFIINTDNSLQQKGGKRRDFKAVIFNSDKIFWFSQDILAVESNETVQVPIYQENKTNGKRTGFYSGVIRYLFTQNEIIKYVQKGEQSKYEFDMFIFSHNLGYIPACYLGGITIRETENHILTESFVSGCIPSWNKSIWWNSDVDAAMTMHLYPPRWEFRSNQCKECKGTKHVEDPNCAGCQPQTYILCEACKGSGVTGSPYEVIEIDPDSLPSDHKLSDFTPPLGYVDIPVDGLKLAIEQTQNAIYEGLSAINFEYVANIPLAQSGIAKGYDRQEINGTLNMHAENLMRLYKEIAEYVNDLRYNANQPGERTKADREKNLPKCSVPLEFDVVSSSLLAQELTAAINGQFSPDVIAKIQVNFVRSFFGDDDPTYKYIELVWKLNPLSTHTTDEIVEMFTAGGMTHLQFLVCIKIGYYVTIAMEEDINFYDNEFQKQVDVINLIAQKDLDEIIAKQDEKTQKALLNTSPNPNTQTPDPAGDGGDNSNLGNGELITSVPNPDDPNNKNSNSMNSANK